MKKTIGLISLLFLPLALAAPPDFSVNYRFTNRTGETTDAITIFTAPASTPAIPNYIYGCSAWQLTYNSEGFSVISLNFQTNTRVWTGGIQQGPGNAVSTFGGTSVVGTLPLTATTQGTFIGYGYYPYVYINLATATGTGSVDVQLKCWNSITYAYNGNYVAGNLVTSAAGFLNTTLSVQVPTSDVICAHGGDTSIAGITCNNTAGTEATAATLFSTLWAQPAGIFTVGRIIRLCGEYRYWSSATAPNAVPGMYYTSTGNQLYGPASSLAPGGGVAHNIYSSCLDAVATAANSIWVFPNQVFSLAANTYNTANSVNSFPLTMSAAVNWYFSFYWNAATGIFSANCNDASNKCAGTITGTIGQTCTLTAFNNGNTAGTATVALTGTNLIANGTAIVVTNTGYGSTSAPTSATFGNGTATCSGTAAFTGGVLGGAQGNAVQLLAMIVTQVN